jgi:hypothetical protein
MIHKKSKVEVELVGGIGNQLFGYFAGNYIANACNSDLHLRIMKPNHGETVHSGSICELNLQGIFLFDKSAKLSRALNRITKKMLRSSSAFARIYSNLSRSYNSNEIGFDKNIETLESPIRISGYYQTWKYFNEFQHQIRGNIDISIKSDWYLEWKDKAINGKVVMLHIRLGDYLNKQNDSFGSLSTEYYKRALECLPVDLARNQIWVFSDDIDSARGILSKISGYDFVWIKPPPSTSPAESLLLMSFGAANIIANSTYSWWGAMLNNHKPVVLAPSKWFKLLEDPKDLIPENWIRIESSWN